MVNGPGDGGASPVTRDGCPVELYRRLPYGGEVERFAGLLPAGASVLELGCGTGRITGALLEHGFEVTAVDNSPDMLRFVPERARRVCADIETLELGRTFDAVLLASCLVNTADEALREGLLRSCARHLAMGRLLVLERHDPEWLAHAQPGPTGRAGAVSICVESLRREGSRVDMGVRYEDGELVWRHAFQAVVLDDEATGRALSRAGFGPPAWLDERRRWGSAARDATMGP